MAQSTSHPDCVHCRFMVRHQNGAYRCRQHDIILHTPVSIFCKMITLSERSDLAYKQWFDEAIDGDGLETNTLYTWVETPTRDRNGKRAVQVDAEIIAPLTSYLTWSAGTFWKIIRSLRRAKRNHYRKHGFMIDDGK